jgi:hypothetical protein
MCSFKMSKAEIMAVCTIQRQQAAVAEPQAASEVASAVKSECQSAWDATSVNSFTTPAITTYNGGTQSVGFIRIPMAATGSHYLDHCDFLYGIRPHRWAWLISYEGLRGAGICLFCWCPF